MKFCQCILGSTKPELCKGCTIMENNNINGRFDDGYAKFHDLYSKIWRKAGEAKFMDENKVAKIKKEIEELTLGEIKQLVEYFKKFEIILK